MSFFSDLVDKIPVVGQVKGLVHHAVGDTEGADRAMERSTRATGCVAVSLDDAVTSGVLIPVVSGGVASMIADSFKKVCDK